MTDLLQKIQHLQFEDRGRAESLLREFIQATFPSLDVDTVELRPQAVSLNSFNGFLKLDDDQRLFFKTHTEQDNVIDEYYNAKLLAESGYPVIQPMYSSTQAGQHLLIYELISVPSVFDVAWSIEQGEEKDSFDTLKAAQIDADKQLFDLYMATLELQSLNADRKAPVHQLFLHRLVGGRFHRFYGDNVEVELPNKSYKMRNLLDRRWIINGQEYEESLNDIVNRITMHTFNSNQFEAELPSVIGHGDAHNGNVFFYKDLHPPQLIYFDPAFAGRHHPLIDIVKPLFHNVFAMWMYFPQVKLQTTRISVRDKANTLQVDYDYDLPAVRQMFLNSKIDHVLLPVLTELKRRNWLAPNWRDYLKAALCCCPLLTLNLADSQRFSPEIRALGFTMTVEMGSESQQKRSFIDQRLDEISEKI